MFRPEQYEEHNLSLNRFIELFNNSDIYENLLMLKTPCENYLADGFFIDMDTGLTMGFDWTKASKKRYKNSKFMYKEILIVNSKLNISTNTIIIETDISEKYFSVVFVEDLKQSPIVYFSDVVGGEKIKRQARKTEHFKTYAYKNIEDFKYAAHKALQQQTYNYTIL